MFDLDRILNDPTPLAVVVPGTHGALAERYRDRALHKIALGRILLEMLDYFLREQPDNDKKFDEAAAEIYPLFRAIGLEVEAFRDTRQAKEN